MHIFRQKIKEMKFKKILWGILMLVVVVGGVFEPLKMKENTLTLSRVEASASKGNPPPKTPSGKTNPTLNLSTTQQPQTAADLNNLNGWIKYYVNSNQGDKGREVVNFISDPTKKAAAQAVFDTEVKGRSAPAGVNADEQSCAGAFYLNLDVCVKKLAAIIGYYVILTPAAKTMSISAYLMNYVVNYTVVEMKLHTIDATEINNGITTVWATIRDLSNMIAIWWLLYVAISTILGRGGSAEIKKTLVAIITAAILINFSLFFTKTIIDLSNIMTLKFLNGIQQINTPAAGKTPDLAAALSKGLDITSIYAPVETTGKTNISTLTIDAIFIVSIGGSIFMFITSVVFLAIALLLIVRYVVLIVIMMFSPLMVLGSTLPKIGEFSNQWWSVFSGQCLFAPILMLFLWIINVLIARGLLKAPATATFSGVFTGDISGSIGLVMNFIVLISLLTMSLVVAKKFASQGSETIAKVVSKATGWTDTAISRIKSAPGNVALGTTGMVGRNTAGRLASYADKKWSNRIGWRPGDDENWYGRLINKVTETATLSGNSKIGRALRANTTGAVAGAKFGGSQTWEEDKKLAGEVTEKRNQIRENRKLDEEAAPGATDAEKEALEAAQLKILSNRSDKDITELGAKTIEKLVLLLSPRQLEYQLSDKNEKWSTAQKEKVRDARFKSIADSLNRIRELEEEDAITPFNPATDGDKIKELKSHRDKIRTLSSKEIELGKEFTITSGAVTTPLLTNSTFVANMTQGQVDGIMKPDNIAYLPSQKTKLRDMRTAPITEVFENITLPARGAPPLPPADKRKREVAAQKARKMDVKEFMRLPEKTLYSPEVLATLDERKLKKISTADEDSSVLPKLLTEIKAQGDVIRGFPLTPGNPIPAVPTGLPTEDTNILKLANWVSDPANEKLLI